MAALGQWPVKSRMHPNAEAVQLSDEDSRSAARLGRSKSPQPQLETPEKPLDQRVEKMRLSKDKTQRRYNEFLTLDGIPAEAFGYLLSNRSALKWVIDQYRVKTNRCSEIVNDPKRAEDPQYIVRLNGKVIRVSLETVGIVGGVPGLGVWEERKGVGWAGSGGLCVCAGCGWE